MNFKRKKLSIIVIVILLIGITSFSSLYIYNKYLSKPIIETKTAEPLESNNQLAYYVEDSYGSNTYSNVNEFSWNNELYIYNSAKSYCLSGSPIVWNDETKTASIEMDNADKCYLYFDKEQSTPDIVVASATTAYSNPNFFASKILADNGGEAAILAKDAPNFSEQAPNIISYKDGELTGPSTYNPNVNNYFTYADSYNLNTATGKYNLKNSDNSPLSIANNVLKYSDNYSSLVGKYIGYITGGASESYSYQSDRITIYRVVSASASTITYDSLTVVPNVVDNSLDGVYAADDDYTALTGKKSYYYRGAVDNNWVYFANKYWRIIRINGDGSVRIMYSGTVAPTEAQKSVMTTSETQIGPKAFNSSSDSAEYVGWKYTLGQGHGLETSSTIKGNDESPADKTIDKWYETNIANNSTNLSKINHNQILCNDRSAYKHPSNPQLISGVGSTTTKYFGAYVRNILEHRPSLICPDNRDKFTVDGVVTGNEALTYPVGLITADEVKMAGMIYNKQNTVNYLYTGQTYWTASPYYFNGNNAYAFLVYSRGYLSNNYVPSALGARPVVSLKSDIAVTGTGQYNDPYVVN